MSDPLSRRSLLIALSAPAVAWPLAAQALCASPPEAGRWRNIDPKGEHAVIDLRMADCGDQVLNGQQTESSYRLQVWVLQSSGKLYGRPPVPARYQSWKGQQWLVGRVPTGGYLDHVWANAEQHDGERRLHVLIKHESLDSKPSAQSEHWFRYEKAV
jgi:hypothetical protein